MTDAASFPFSNLTSDLRPLSSEIEPALARGLRQGLDAAVIEVSAAVEHDVLDALLLRALGDELAHRLRRVDAGAGLQAFPRRLLDRGGRSDRDALIVIDHLRIDVLGRAEYGKPLALAGRTAQ